MYLGVTHPHIALWSQLLLQLVLFVRRGEEKRAGERGEGGRGEERVGEEKRGEERFELACFPILIEEICVL